MDFSLDRPDGFLFVRRVTPTAVTVVDRELTQSFVLTPERVIEAWPVASALALDESHVPDMLELKPELVLLGTGSRQQFPPAAFLAGFLRKGVGIEVMDNAAAARTYDLLAAEGRRVIVAFILPGE
jgi:uncharacterized protein